MYRYAKPDFRTSLLLLWGPPFFFFFFSRFFFPPGSSGVKYKLVIAPTVGTGGKRFGRRELFVWLIAVPHAVLLFIRVRCHALY